MQGWFTAQCSGDWEHDEGIRIETLDKPGWSLRTRLTHTAWGQNRFSGPRLNAMSHDWVHAWVEGGAYNGVCGPTNLSEALFIFREWVSGWLAAHRHESELVRAPYSVARTPRGRPPGMTPQPCRHAPPSAGSALAPGSCTSFVTDGEAEKCWLSIRTYRRIWPSLSHIDVVRRGVVMCGDPVSHRNRPECDWSTWMRDSL